MIDMFEKLTVEGRGMKLKINDEIGDEIYEE